MTNPYRPPPEQREPYKEPLFDIVWAGFIFFFIVGHVLAGVFIGLIAQALGYY